MNYDSGMTRSPWRRALCAALCASASMAAHALDLRPGGAFVQAGSGERAQCTTAGVIWPWAWKHDGWGGQWTAATEAFVSHWRAGAYDGGHQGFTQVGLVPMFRLRFDEGRSAWFVEGGIGITVLDKHYRTPERQFSTRFNFIDSIAVGRNFGDRHQHELSLRAVHVSNADIKRPNPGEDFLQLRYTARF
jgi:lipid A 3-O-deacylase